MQQDQVQREVLHGMRLREQLKKNLEKHFGRWEKIVTKTSKTNQKSCQNIVF